MIKNSNVDILLYQNGAWQCVNFCKNIEFTCDITAFMIDNCALCYNNIIFTKNSFTNFSCENIKFKHFRHHFRNKNLANDAINSLFD
jgi:hypothetical protein